MRNFYKLVFLTLFTFKVGVCTQGSGLELETETIRTRSFKISQEPGVIYDSRTRKIDLKTAMFIDYGDALAKADLEAEKLPTNISVPRNCGHIVPTQYTFDQLVSIAQEITKAPAGGLDALLDRLYVMDGSTLFATVGIRTAVKRVVLETAAA